MSEQKNKSNINVQQMLYNAQMVNYNQKNEDKILRKDYLNLIMLKH